MSRALLVAALLGLAGCAHLTAQLVAHAPEIAAYAGVAAGAAQVASMVNSADAVAVREREAAKK